MFTHPNGWEGAQQQQIRRAVELAGLMTSNVTSTSEAILHFCVANVIASDGFSSTIAVSDSPVDVIDQSGSQGVAIVDVGGGAMIHPS